MAAGPIAERNQGKYYCEEKIYIIEIFETSFSKLCVCGFFRCHYIRWRPGRKSFRIVNVGTVCSIRTCRCVITTVLLKLFAIL